MATVNFFYRSKKERAPLTVRLQYWNNNKAFFVDAKTNLFISLRDWEIYQKNKKTNNKDAAIKNIKALVNKDHSDLEELILTKLNVSPLDNINKLWLQNIVSFYYNPEVFKEGTSIPTDVIPYIDHYIKEQKLNKIVASKYRVLKARLEKFQNHRKKPITFLDFNFPLAYDFVRFYKVDLNYMENTIKRDFGYISSLINEAQKDEIKISNRRPDFKLSRVRQSDLYKNGKKEEKILYQYFNNDEIKTIENLTGLSESLDNVKDWLLISLWTGQRISDFKEFTKELIIESEGELFIKINQKKTGAEVWILITDDIQRILDKRNGEFPRKIEDQKYNLYMKKVVQKAGFTENVMGYKDQIIEGLGKRRVFGEYERWEIVSSHIGRRSFATNNYGLYTIDQMKSMTGHKTESQFLNYIQKSAKERGHEIARIAKIIKEENLKK